MRFDIMTLFPKMIDDIMGESIIGRAQNKGVLEIFTHNIRDFSEDKHRRVDDTTYGGGMGMLMSAPPIYRCWKSIIDSTDYKKRKTVYMSPQGRVLTQSIAKEYIDYDQVIILCGHYEGVDRRIVDEIVDDEISIGDYVLTGGELPACIFVDCVARMVEGVLSNDECFENESIACGILEYPQYTRPLDFMGRKVPDVLVSGNHEEVRRWRYEAALELTKKNRPDLL